jgi:Phage tail protein.
MALSTDVYWDIGGVPLQTLAYNITTFGGDLNSPPTLRGEDLTIPYRPGTVFTQRRPNGRTITFNMWVQGSDVDGKVPTSVTQRAEFEKNFKMLRNLFWNQGNQVNVTKRWKDYGSSVVQTATAKAVFSSGISPEMQGNSHASYSVEMYLSDPFFYGPQQTITFAALATSNQTFTVLGDYETTEILVDFDGARNNMRLTNTSAGVYVNVNHNLAAGQEIILDVSNFKATKNPTGTPQSVIGNVTYFGHPFWMVLRPGSQTLSMTSSSGAGGGNVKYSPRWL